MPDSLSEQKSACRALARKALGALSPEQRKGASRTICETLVKRDAWQKASSVLLFAPMADEPDVWSLVELAIASGKTVALPRFVAADGQYEAASIQDPLSDVGAGKFGILEPAAHCKAAELNRLDLVLVPGVAFDWHRRRLGRGRGFYDRLLAEVSGTTCGVAFDQQMVEAIPVEPHDVRLNCILTPSHWLEL